MAGTGACHYAGTGVATTPAREPATTPARGCLYTGTGAWHYAGTGLPLHRHGGCLYAGTGAWHYAGTGLATTKKRGSGKYNRSVEKRSKQAAVVSSKSESPNPCRLLMTILGGPMEKR